MLYERLRAALERDFHAFEWSCVFVDDGSIDTSLEKLQALHEKDERVKVISFSRNFGQHVAIAAGIDACDSDWAVLMDGDLQDPPESIISLFEKAQEGYDLVYGLKEDRKDKKWRGWSGSAFWWLIRKASGLDMPVNQAMLRIFNRKVIGALQEIKEQERFYAGLFAWVGFHQTSMPIPYQERQKGETKYSLRQLFSLTLTALFAFSDRLPNLIMLFGGAWLMVSWLFLTMFLAFNAPFLAFLIWLICMATGSIILCIGLVSIYLQKNWKQAQQRPLYIIQEKIGFE